MATTVSDRLVGTLVDGRYEVVSRIARGGMATVYLAVDRRLDRNVALKVMHPHLADGVEGAEFVSRFRREARSAARLAHPGLVAVYDQGFDGETSYLTMEYVAGTNLRRRLRTERTLTLGATLDLLEEILDALTVAHRAGLVHRDIKPENVLLTEEGHVKLADFGLARAVTEVTATATGTVLGTVAYLSPEVITTGGCDPRADVYSVGILASEMLLGRLPFTGESPIQVAYRHVNEDVPPPSRTAWWMPVEIDELVCALAARDPDDRPRDAAAALVLVRATRAALSPAELERRADPPAGPAGRSAASGEPSRPDPAAPGTTVRLAAGAAGSPDHDGADDAGRDGEGPVVTDGHPAPVDGPGTQGRQGAEGHQGVEGHQRVEGHPDVEGRRDVEGPTEADTTTSGGVENLDGVHGTLTLAPGRGALASGPSAAADDEGALDAIPTAAFAQLGAGGTRPPTGGRPGRTASAGRPVSGEVPVTVEPAAVVAARRRRRRRRRVLVILGSVLAAALFVGVWTVWTTVGPGAYTAVPTNLVGTTVEEATATLDAVSLRYDVTQAYDDDVPRGDVVSVRPDEGATVRKKDTIHLVESLGIKKITVPDGLVGTEADAVLATLDKVGFDNVSKPTTAYSDDVPAGHVISVTPGPGTKAAHNVRMMVVVSDGPAPVTVPQVTGAALDDARATLGAQGLEVEVKEKFSDDVPQGAVISQSPRQSTTALRGDTVTLTVSKGPQLFAVPDVFGKSSDDARRILEKAGFTVKVEKFAGGLFDRVRFQSPSAGEKVAKKTRVTVTVF